VGGAQPALQGAGELGDVSRFRPGQGRVLGGQGDDPPVGQRRLGPRPVAEQQAFRHRRAGGRVDQCVEGAAQHGPGAGRPVRRVAVRLGDVGLGDVGRPADRGHRGREVTESRRVGAGQHRTPAGRPAVVLGDELRQHPATPGQVAGVPGEHAQVAQRRRRRPRAVRVGLGEGGERAEGCAGRQHQRGYAPRPEPDPTRRRRGTRVTPGPAAGAAALRGRVRALRRAGQVQDQLAACRLGERVADVVGVVATLRLLGGRDRHRPRGQGCGHGPRGRGERVRAPPGP
jgi:hypothetical protein